MAAAAVVVAGVVDAFGFVVTAVVVAEVAMQSPAHTMVCDGCRADCCFVRAMAAPGDVVVGVGFEVGDC